MKNTVPGIPCADLKSAAALGRVLTPAATGFDGHVIPYVQECISGILKIIEQEELRETNTAAFQGLVRAITEFDTVTAVRLLKEKGIPDDLKCEIEKLARKLRNISAQFIEHQSKNQGIKGLFLSKNRAKILDGLGEDLKRAIQEFQASLVANIRFMKQKREDDRLVDKISVDHQAFYTTRSEHQIKLCESGTRVPLLKGIAEWAKGTGPNHPHIMWLHGRAGVGKSIIAKTLIKQFSNKKALGGSFMFSKRNGVTDGSKVFTTLAYQLAHRLPEFRGHVGPAIRVNNEKSTSVARSQQFQDLLVGPLSKLPSPPVTVIILDALDECSPETLTSMLTSIVENIMYSPFLRFVVTSRPENHIREVLQRFPERIQEINMDDVSTSEDIAKYLRARLGDIHNRLVCEGDQNPAWPSNEDIASLVNAADNLFLFAEIAVRFVGDECAANPPDRLKTILAGQHIGEERPLSALDRIYRQILQNALPEADNDLHERFQDVLGTIVFSPKPLSVDLLAELLAPKHNLSDIKSLLKRLLPVLIIPDNDGKHELWVYHESFLDFMTNLERCTPVTAAYLDPLTHHVRLCLLHFEMATAAFDTLPAATGPEDIRSDSYVESALWTTSFSLSHWLHHLRAVGEQTQNGTTKDVMPSVAYKAQAFLELVRKYEHLYGYGVIYEETPSQFHAIKDLLKKGIQFCDDEAPCNTA